MQPLTRSNTRTFVLVTQAHGVTARTNRIAHMVEGLIVDEKVSERDQRRYSDVDTI